MSSSVCMWWKVVVPVCVCVSALLQLTNGETLAPLAPTPTEEDALEFLKAFDANATALGHIAQEADWAFATNITEENSQRALEANAVAQNALGDALERAEVFFADDLYLTFSETTARLFGQLKLYRDFPTNEDSRRRLNELVNDMEENYSSATVCPDENMLPSQCVHLDPDLEAIMAESRNYSELLNVWSKWRDEAGKPIAEKFGEYVKLSNEGATDFGHADMGASWRSGYDMPPEEFERLVEELWGQVAPLYEELHCFVRRKLAAHYEEFDAEATEFIPAHLLGNMWAQEWLNIYDIVAPFPDEPELDVTAGILKKNLSSIQMHAVSEQFFTSLGFDPLPKAFWDKSLFERPSDGRDVVCHASAWDFGKDDLRIKMCTKPTEADLLTIHHEQGHLFYDQSYSDQPYLFRSGANDGFHEAVGDTMQLSVATPAHLESIGLIESGNVTEEGELNVLMRMALQKVAFLPFGYLIDKWRWEVFAGLPPERYNERWWELRERYQGVAAPVARDSTDFDPGAKYHVPASVPYMRYFLAHIYLFQFHASLCEVSGHDGPLHRCDISATDPDAAGKAMRDMLSLGSSKPWPEALSKLRGEITMSAESLLEYFRPLHEWLKEQNQVQTDAGAPQCWSAPVNPTDGSRVSPREGLVLAIVVVVGVLCVGVAVMWRIYRKSAQPSARQRIPNESRSSALKPLAHICYVRVCIDNSCRAAERVEQASR